MLSTIETTPPAATAGAPTRRNALRAILLGAAAVVVIALALDPMADTLNRAIPALALLVPVIAAAVRGGRTAAVVVAVVATFGYATSFLPPLGSAAIDREEDVGVAAMFVVVAAATGLLTASTVEAERRRSAAERARNDALEHLDEQRAALLRSVSHDLRTPLASIHAAATDLRAGTPYDPAIREKLLDVIIDQTERLDRLVANVLSLSRIEAGGFVPDRQVIDLVELVEACAARLERALLSQQVTITATAPALVEADYSQIDQVVSNLLENAADHSAPGDAIEVAVREVDGQVAVAVVDHGSGIDPAVRDRLFEPFATTTTSATRGIGLTICRSIVEAHGGSIDASDTPGGGATFRFSLAAARP